MEGTMPVRAFPCRKAELSEAELKRLEGTEPFKRLSERSSRLRLGNPAHEDRSTPVR